MALIKTVNTQTILLSMLSLLACIFITACISISLGTVQTSYQELFNLLFSKVGLAKQTASPLLQTIIFEIRLPRVFLAAIVGGALAVAGVVFQVMLKNTLAEPYILGISSGASVGFLIAVATGISAKFLGAAALFAFLGALIVIIAVYHIGNRKGVFESGSLLLSGVMIGAFLSAVILALVVLIGDRARNALFWLLGNLGTSKSDDTFFVFPIIILCFFIILYHARHYNLLALGDETAQHLGVKIKTVQKVSYIVSSLMTGVVVSISGAIGFVGLIVPHICRMIFGADHRMLIPSAFLTGALFLIIADTIARMVLSPMEMPVGAVTALIGAPLFIILLKLSD